jgi:hypothetical protein
MVTYIWKILPHWYRGLGVPFFLCSATNASTAQLPYQQLMCALQRKKRKEKMKKKKKEKSIVKEKGTRQGEAKEGQDGCVYYTQDSVYLQ